MAFTLVIIIYVNICISVFRKGDVKFYLDPYRDVVTVTKFGSLRSSLQKGKMIRMTTELDKCSGGKSDHVIVGGEFRSKYIIQYLTFKYIMHKRTFQWYVDLNKTASFKMNRNKPKKQNHLNTHAKKIC